MARRWGELETTLESPPPDTPEREEGWLERRYGEAGLPIGLPLNSTTTTTLEASRVVKAGAGTLLSVLQAQNAAGTGVWLLFFDTQAGVVPANGAVPTFAALSAAATNSTFIAWSRWGRAFHQGLIIAASTTLATLTLASASNWFDVVYV